MTMQERHNAIRYMLREMESYEERAAYCIGLIKFWVNSPEEDIRAKEKCKRIKQVIDILDGMQI